MLDLLVTQVADPFRIALCLGLVYTMHQTRAVTGTLVPLIAGVLFIAVMIPMTLSRSDLAPLGTQIATGVLANAVWVGTALALWRFLANRR